MISFTKDDVVKIIINLVPNKTYDHDMISVCTLKFSRESILKPLELIFKSYIDSRKFPVEWKKANVVLVPKKYKQLKENYFSILLLPICGNILEQLIYNTMLEFFTYNKLNSSYQSGFKPGDS